MEAVEESADEAELRARDWFSANKLLLNTNKTQEIWFALRSLNGRPNPDSVKFLGIRLDQKLKWDCHIEEVCGKLRSTVFLLRNLSECVSIKTLLTAYHALFHSVMSYGIMAWGEAATSSRVFALQRKAVRIIAGLGYRDDCRGTFRKLEVLTFPSVFILSSLTHIKKNERNFLCHGDIHDHLTRGRSDLVAAHCRLTKSQKRPEYIAIKLFNRLPMGIRQLPLHKFKKTVKKHLANAAVYSTEEYLN
ncbi:uncharacterized protein LOC123682843 [Harmonia axyridis]|uniref:uncharacterized protein LOC123682843 n=1 Tax=Harmonia axyridis TaxID=115357 RepID=UPI001E27922F|nr:uncharacterized protein LOC123682843 [Harmonia axyridis]